MEHFLSRNYYPPQWTLSELRKVPSIPAATAAVFPTAKAAAAVVQAPTVTSKLPLAVPQVATVWKPGLTVIGERILGMSPFERTDIEGRTCILKCSFYVKKVGQKIPIACYDSGKVGKKASHAYLHEVPESERRDLRTHTKKYTSADQEGFKRVKADYAKDVYNEEKLFALPTNVSLSFPYAAVALYSYNNIRDSGRYCGRSSRSHKRPVGPEGVRYVSQAWSVSFLPPGFSPWMAKMLHS